MIDLDKFVAVLNEMESERGRFWFFGLFLRETSNDRWDLVVAAPWLRSDRWDDLKFVSEKVTARLNKKELVELARIVIVDDDDPELNKLLNSWHVEKVEWVHVANRNFFGKDMKHAYFLRIDRLPKSAAK